MTIVMIGETAESVCVCVFFSPLNISNYKAFLRFKRLKASVRLSDTIVGGQTC